jgi:acyl carrier protein
VTPAEGAVEAELSRMLREELDPGGEPASPEEPLAARLDSLQLLTLVVAVEDRFHVVLTDDDAAHARSLADLARLVADRAPADRLPAPEEAP